LDLLVILSSVFRDLRSEESLNLQFQSIGSILIGRGVSYELQKFNIEIDVRESSVRRIRFHDMRHTAATLMLASGVQLNTVKEICGHASITTTMGYVHLLADSVKDAGIKFSLSSATPPTPMRELLQMVR